MKLFDTRHWIVFAAGVLADQASKFWAVHALAFPDGTPDPSRGVRVIGDLLRFQLAYNPGAAFSSSPQKLLPWLSPTLFFGMLVIAATIGLFFFYRGLPVKDTFSRIGTSLILAGAWGNFIDRLHIGKVVDFIDSDFPDAIMTRWPTFNIADSCVSVGVCLVLLGPLLLKRRGQADSPAQTASSEPAKS